MIPKNKSPESVRKQGLFDRAHTKDPSDLYARNFRFFFIVTGKRLWIMGFNYKTD